MKQVKRGEEDRRLEDVIEVLEMAGGKKFADKEDI